MKYIAVVIALAAPALLSAQNPPSQPPVTVAAPGAPPPDSSARATAVRAAQSPVIDGRESDDVWRTAPVHSDFREFSPKEGNSPRFRTEFKAAFDDRNLYIFIRNHDSAPDSIMRALSRRDVRGPSDQIKIMVDSYFDRRNGYEFAVNPDGVKRDYAMYNDRDEDESWDAIWDVSTRIDSAGWTAEFRIPLSQMRYTSAPRHTFGFAIWRDIERHKERVSWPQYFGDKNGLVSQLGRLEGIAGISSPQRLEVTPYTVAKNVSRQKAGPSVAYE
ncbi:MAG: carbohydrate binding family 9 domain-containing protein, partial [Gemmatimonadaceae bacterium]